LCGLSSALYQFISLGDDDTEQPEFSASDYEQSTEADNGEPPLLRFQPRPLKNLLLVDDLNSLCPIIDAKVLSRPSDGPTAAPVLMVGVGLKRHVAGALPRWRTCSARTCRRFMRHAAVGRSRRCGFCGTASR